MANKILDELSLGNRAESYTDEFEISYQVGEVQWHQHT